MTKSTWPSKSEESAVDLEETGNMELRRRWNPEEEANSNDRIKWKVDIDMRSQPYYNLIIYYTLCRVGCLV